jgi:hypothetical protein
MKKLLLIAFFGIIAISNAQEKDSKVNKLDKKMFGSWKGSENDNQRKGLVKYWIQHRFEDGTFLLLFTAIENGEVESFVEKGQWWIENGEFHELHFNSGKTDIYTYTFVDENNVKFKAKKVGVSFENSEYEFIDTKIEDQ